MCKTLIFGLLAGLSNLAAADTVYYLDLINTAASNVVSFEVALPGSELFRSVLPAGAPLHGGGDIVRGRHRDAETRRGDDHRSGTRLGGEAVDRMQLDHFVTERPDDAPAARGGAERHRQRAHDLDPGRDLE